MKTYNIQYITYCVLALVLNYTVAYSQNTTVNTGIIQVMPGTQFATIGHMDNQNGASFVNDGETFIYGYLNNDGAVDFTSGLDGYTRFEGTTSQLITGSNPCYFYDVLFNNSSNSLDAIAVVGHINIAGEANFLEGIVNNDDFGGTITFEEHAAHINTSNESNVDGHVQKVGDTAFLYPIGDAQLLYRPAGISAPSNETHLFTAKYFYEDTNLKYPTTNLGSGLQLVDGKEHWLIERTIGDSGVMITLSWNTNTTPDEIIASPLEELRIARWDNGLQQWIDQGGTINKTDQTITTVVDDYGIFTLARGIVDNLPCEYMEVHNLITPDDDGINDALKVKLAANSCVEQINVKIYNRWGSKVFEANNYETEEHLFKGYSEGRLTVLKDRGLPTGTYFYILTYKVTSGNRGKNIKTGYLYIN